MEEIYQYLQLITNYSLDTIRNETTNEIDNIFVNAGTVYYSITGPHSGNGFSFLLRADAAATHDRWSNCDWEYEFSTKEEVIAFFRIGGMEALAMYVKHMVQSVLDTVEIMIREVSGN